LALENIIVSFKQNLRVINKATNRFLHYNEEGKKIFVKQGKGDNWAIRKSMHKDTVFGEVNLRRKQYPDYYLSVPNDVTIFFGYPYQ